MKSIKLLIVVDESPATRKALQYVAQMQKRFELRAPAQMCLGFSVP
jgi:hypothetical protein